ncbi:methionyl-tRNA formyltransferase [Lysobacter korlensis]|uniref:Methionyl-tRNA formyltransferase n=1 Tax=Lysobacter korlensis TaxID=553636 RepID=A0ABV6RZF6_9GAMM
MTALRLVFAGSPEAAVPSLRAVLASDHEVAGVLTRQDSPQGRKRALTPTPVAAAAAATGVPVWKSNRLAPVAEAITDARPDLGVIVAYGGLVREPLLSAPRLGWINLHFSLLPRWRGAAPVQHAILAGDELTGATVFQLVEELDAGDVYGRLTAPIGPRETAGELLGKLATSGAELLVRVIDNLATGEARPEPQAGDVTLAPKLALADGRIDWTEPAPRVRNRVRAMTPEPGAHTEVDGARFKIHAVAPADSAAPLAPGRIAAADGRVLAGTGSAPVELVTVQPAGKTPMPASDWWRGTHTQEVVAR